MNAMLVWYGFPISCWAIHIWFRIVIFELNSTRLKIIPFPVRQFRNFSGIVLQQYLSNDIRGADWFLLNSKYQFCKMSSSNRLQKMKSEKTDPEKIELVTFLRSKIGDWKKPLYPSFAARIVRRIFNENGGKLRGMSKVDFLARAQKIFDQKQPNCGSFCSICYKTFHNWCDKEMHEQCVHQKDESKKFKCSSCNKGFLSKTSLKYHIDIAHSETKSVLTCDHCKKSFHHEVTLRRHIQSIHDHSKLKPKCDLCEKTFSRKDKLTRHTQKVHRLQYIEFAAAEKDMKQEDGSFKCNRCSKIFAGDRAFKDMTIHMVNKCKDPVEIKCEECRKPFSNQFNLRRHIKIEHNVEISMFHCNSCDFSSGYKWHLARHLKTQHNKVLKLGLQLEEK